MLSQLTIKNFGLIDHVSLDFTDQLNILTGETGAGKSILIDALRFVLGDRIHAFQLRDAEKTCVVDAIFEIHPPLNHHPLIKDVLLDEESTLILQRSLNAENRSRAKINGLTVTIAQLKQIGALLLDFHGPHDHQHLLAQDNHIHMLDQLNHDKDALKKYRIVYDQWITATKELAALQQRATTRERDLDFLKHQLQELKQVPLTQEDYDSVEQEFTKISNAEKLLIHIQTLISIFDNEDVGIDRQLSAAFHPMQQLTRTDEHAQHLLDQLDQLQLQSQDLVSALHDYANSLQFDGEHAEMINQQYAYYQTILRKYGPTVNDAAQFYAEATQKYDDLNNMDHNDQLLQKSICDYEKQLKTLSKNITLLRTETAASLKGIIETELKELGFDHVEFETRITTTSFDEYGANRVEFFISPNAGETLKPLANIISSGEAARIMLALKKALIHVDPVPVLIFDEIDAQIGGRLGTITGTKLQDIAHKRQVILITHLPQIASFAQTHYKITKKVIEGRATTQVAKLNDKQRIDEIAHMMSGADQDSIARTHAQKLLAKAQT